MDRTRQVLALAAVALVTVSLAGCARSGPVYAETSNEYSAANVDALFENAQATDIESHASARSEELRHRALVNLRDQGPGASSAADLITETFPADTRGVPVYVERAAYGGTEAVFLLEAIGPQGGSLDDTRLWVISEAGEVLYSEVR